MKKGKSYSGMNELSALLRKATTLTGAHNTVFMAHYARPNFSFAMQQKNFVHPKRHMTFLTMPLW